MMISCGHFAFVYVRVRCTLLSPHAVLLHFKSQVETNRRANPGTTTYRFRERIGSARPGQSIRNNEEHKRGPETDGG